MPNETDIESAVADALRQRFAVNPDTAKIIVTASYTDVAKCAVEAVLATFEHIGYVHESAMNAGGGIVHQHRITPTVNHISLYRKASE